jgi:hypothetical protein
MKKEMMNILVNNLINDVKQRGEEWISTFIHNKKMGEDGYHWDTGSKYFFDIDDTKDPLIHETNIYYNDEKILTFDRDLNDKEINIEILKYERLRKLKRF